MRSRRRWLLLLAMVFAAPQSSRVASAQAPEYAFRLLKTLSVGPLTLENLAVTSVAVEGIDSFPDSTDYRLSLAFGPATIVKLSSPEGGPLIELRGAAGSIRGTFRTAPGHPESIRTISVRPKGLSIRGQFRDTIHFPGPLAGLTAHGAATVSNNEALELDRTSSGVLLITPRTNTAQSALISLSHAPGATPVRWNARATRPPSLAFDTAIRSLRVDSADYALALPADAEVANLKLIVGRETIQPTSRPNIDARLRVALDHATFAIDKAEFVAPLVRVADAGAVSPDVKAVENATIASLRAEYSIKGREFVLTATTARSVTVRPDREKVAELVNDGRRVPNQLVPTGDPTVPYVGSHALRGLYDGLVRASIEPRHDHSILLIAEKEGIVSEAHHRSMPRQDDGDGPPVICVAIGTGAGWAVSGLGLAAAVKTMLPIAFTAGLKGGTILTPAATPYVFAGVMAVGVPTLWVGTQFFANTAIEEGAGIPCGADLGDPKNLLGCAIAKGVEKFCEMAIAFGANGAPTREGWPVKTPTMSTLEFMEMRRQMLKQELNSWRPPRPGERPAWLSADPRPHQNAWFQNGSVWRDYNGARVNELEQRHAAQDAERRRQWLEQQNANAAASNEQQRIYDDIVREDEARLRSAIGGSAGGPVRVTIPIGPSTSGGGMPGGGAGGGSGTCAGPAGYQCLQTTVPVPRRQE